MKVFVVRAPEKAFFFKLFLRLFFPPTPLLSGQRQTSNPLLSQHPNRPHLHFSTKNSFPLKKLTGALALKAHIPKRRVISGHKTSSLGHKRGWSSISCEILGRQKSTKFPLPAGVFTWWLWPAPASAVKLSFLSWLLPPPPSPPSTPGATT